MSTPANFRLCIDRIVPQTQERRSLLGRVVLDIQRGARPAGLLSADDSALERPRMAIIAAKTWPHREINCKFLDGTKAQRSLVERFAHEWEDHASIKFIFGNEKGEHIRISFTADSGSWSAVGTDALNETYFPAHQPTMNFGWLKDDTEKDEYRRVVLHEFGHALGCIHEHQSPDENLQWDKGAVYKYFSGAPNYWSKAEIDRNVLSRYSPKGMNFTRFDSSSIMLYMFPGALFKTGEGTPNNSTLSKGDKEFIGTLYPMPRQQRSKKQVPPKGKPEAASALDRPRTIEGKAPRHNETHEANSGDIDIPVWV